MKLKTTLAACAALTALALATSASAAVMIATITGVVVAGRDDSNTFGYAGNPDGVPEGTPFKAVIRYDTALGNPTGAPNAYDDVQGGSTYSAVSPILSATLEINHNVRAFASDTIGEVCACRSVGYFYVNVTRYNGPLTGTTDLLQLTYRDPSVPFSLTSPFEGSFNSDLPGGTVISFPGDNVGMKATHLSIVAASATPEPSTWAMLIVGFAGLGAWLRRRRWNEPIAA